MSTALLSSTRLEELLGEVAQAFEDAHRRGMFTVLWCYLRSGEFVVDGVDHHVSADLLLNAIQDVYLSADVTIA